MFIKVSMVEFPVFYLEVADFRDVSCHVYAESYLTKDGWIPFENLKSSGLAFQLMQNEGKIFLQVRV